MEQGFEASFAVAGPGAQAVPGAGPAEPAEPALGGVEFGDGVGQGRGGLGEQRRVVGPGQPAGLRPGVGHQGQHLVGALAQSGAVVRLAQAAPDLLGHGPRQPVGGAQDAGAGGGHGGEQGVDDRIAVGRGAFPGGAGRRKREVHVPVIGSEIAPEDGHQVQAGGAPEPLDARLEARLVADADAVDDEHRIVHAKSPWPTTVVVVVVTRVPGLP